MRKLQNTLYITTQGSYLHKERETLVVEQERKKVAQLPCIPSRIFCLKTPTIYGHNIPLMPDKTPHQSFVIFAYTVLLIGFSLGEWGLKGETLCFFLCRQVLAFRTLRIQRQPETARLFMNPRCLHTGYPLGGSGEYSADGFAHRAVYCCGFCNISVIFRKVMPL